MISAMLPGFGLDRLRGYNKFFLPGCTGKFCKCFCVSLQSVPRFEIGVFVEFGSVHP